MAITATLMDDDGMLSGQMWMWEKSTDMSFWMDATGAGATTSSYTPEAADDGYYLSATVTYTDGHGSGKSAIATTESMVTLPMDRDGTVRLSSMTPTVGAALTASLSDPDGMIPWWAPR
jgi:hypothetical protein